MFPAVALGAALMSRGRTVVLLTDRRGLAFGRAHAAFWSDVEMYAVRSATPAGHGVCGLLASAFETARGTVEALRLLRRLAPAAVVGFGGYPSLPTMIAAACRRMPTVIHEQNAVLGRVNRLLARWMSAVALAHLNTKGVPRSIARKVTLTGNPVRASIRLLRESAYPHLDPTTPLRLLVTGGSQGAAVFSTVVPAAIASLPGTIKRRLSVVQQCRSEDLDAVAAQYRASGVVAELAPFFPDLPRRLGEAHLVITRGGASSVGELACAGRPAIIVPLPSATDDHQTQNARALVEAGGALLCSQSQFTLAKLGSTFIELFGDPARLVNMAGRARTHGITDAESRLADLVERSLTPSSPSRTPIRERAA